MQSTAALGAEIHEICVFGPGAYLGTNSVDIAARELLNPLAKLIDKQRVLERFDLVLHLLRLPSIEKGQPLFQNVATLVEVRNALTHYKSHWTEDDAANQSLSNKLRFLKNHRPPFVSSGAKFFPDQCLSAECAGWAIK